MVGILLGHCRVGMGLHGSSGFLRRLVGSVHTWTSAVAEAVAAAVIVVIV